jgi:hypothetical protein
MGVELLELIESSGATRVLIDSLSDLQYATRDPVRFREFVYSLTQRLSRAGISPIMTSEIPDLFRVGRLAEYGILAVRGAAAHRASALSKKPTTRRSYSCGRAVWPATWRDSGISQSVAESPAAFA